VVVLNDEINTFQHVVDCLLKYIPAMNPDRAWALAQAIDNEGQAVVWVGPMEQAELYHMQLGSEGLSMAPLERAWGENWEGWLLPTALTSMAW